MGAGQQPALSGEVEDGVDRFGAILAGALEAGFAVNGPEIGGDGSAGHVVFDGVGDVGLGSDFGHGLDGADLTPGPADGAFAGGADGDGLPSAGPDHGDGVSGVQREDVIFVLEQNGGVFGGLLDGGGVRFDVMDGRIFGA